MTTHRALPPRLGAALAAILAAAIVAVAACDGPFTPDPSFGGGATLIGGSTGGSGGSPVGLDTLPAPGAPAGGSATSTPVTLWAISDSTGALTIAVGAVPPGDSPVVNCFWSPNPSSIPWATALTGAISTVPSCLLQVVNGSATVTFGGLGINGFGAVVARL
jgi:hypothetical protein